MKKDKHKDPVKIDEDLSFDEAMKRIMEAPKDEVEDAIREDEEREAKRDQEEKDKRERQP
jgi:hypothetical protein